MTHMEVDLFGQKVHRDGDFFVAHDESEPKANKDIPKCIENSIFGAFQIIRKSRSIVFLFTILLQINPVCFSNGDI